MNMDDTVPPGASGMDLWIRRLRLIMAVLAGAGVAWALVQSLYRAFCYFTNFAFEFDYGVYTNMMWNTAHGDFLRCLYSQSYLSRHLAFFMGLLGGAYWVWDHPFTAAVLQWFALAGGAAILWVLARRCGIAVDHTLALLFFFTAHPYVQCTMLHEIHTSAFYLLLCPWLCYCLLFRKSLAWLPVLVILGLREDAGFYIFPVLLYQAIRDRWIGGYVLAAVAIGYAALACSVFYPMLNDEMSLVARRRLTSGRLLQRIVDVPISARLEPLVWVGIFLLPLLRTAWLPGLVFLAVIGPATSLSPERYQYRMLWHYGGPVIAFLACALLYALADFTRQKRWGRWAPLWFSASLVALTLLAHGMVGYFPGGGRVSASGERIGAKGLLALADGQRIPKDGLLMTCMRYFPFVANRADLIGFGQMDRYGKAVRWVFFSSDDNPRNRPPPEVLRWMRDGTFGVVWWDGFFGLLERGYDCRRNPEVLAVLEQRRTIRFADGLGNASEVQSPPAPSRLSAQSASDSPGEADPGQGTEPVLVRYWGGKVERNPPVIAYGGRALLPAGVYVARFRFKVGAVSPGGGHGPGELQVVKPETGDKLGSAPIAATTTGTWVTQEVTFDLKEERIVEPRVTGGDAELWLDRVLLSERRNKRAE